MYTAKLFLILLPIIFVQCNNNVCKINDVQCTTIYAGRRTHAIVVLGIPGKVRSSDPLIRDEIVVDLPEMKYKLSNVIMYGMKKCQVEILKLLQSQHYQDEYSFDYRLICPHIRIEGDYEIDGKSIKYKGEFKIDGENYHIQFLGKIKTQEACDGKEYIDILNWDVKVETKDKLNYDFQYQFYNIKEKVAPVLNNLHESTKIIADIAPPAIKSLMDDYLSNINEYLKFTPADVVFSTKIKL